MIDLVIFDLDGVLLDSESIYKTVNMNLFSELGAHITDEEYNSFIGISGDKMWGYIKEKAGLTQSIPELRAKERESKFKGLSEYELIPNEGLIQLLDHIKRKQTPICIASSGLMKNINLILSKLEVIDYFAHIVSGEMPKHGKPSPDIFLMAASHFDISPEHCLVIEDSRNGTLAAKAAGMTCVGYINPGSGNQDLSRADFTVRSLLDSQILDLF
ncbi:MAG: HAD family hydrolase [Balneolaceae bacterium]